MPTNHLILRGETTDKASSARLPYNMLFARHKETHGTNIIFPLQIWTGLRNTRDEYNFRIFYCETASPAAIVVIFVHRCACHFCCVRWGEGTTEKSSAMGKKKRGKRKNDNTNNHRERYDPLSSNLECEGEECGMSPKDELLQKEVVLPATAALIGT